MARGMDVHFDVIDAEECARRHPLISTDNLIGGLWDPLDGDIDPAQLCQALAYHARKAGAEVYRNSPVTAPDPATRTTPGPCIPNTAISTVTSW